MNHTPPLSSNWNQIVYFGLVLWIMKKIAFHLLKPLVLTKSSYSSKYKLICWHTRFEKKIIQFGRVYKKLTHNYLLAHVICLFSFFFCRKRLLTIRFDWFLLSFIVWNKRCVAILFLFDHQFATLFFYPSSFPDLFLKSIFWKKNVFIDMADWVMV